MDWLDTLTDFWPHLAAGFTLLAAGLASGHALLHKRDPRAATLWIGIVWLVPLFGPLLYIVLGINRIRRRAVELGVHKSLAGAVPSDLGESQPHEVEHLKAVARAVNRLVSQRLTAGNHIEPLVNGEEAFPAMLEAIEKAQTSITLCSYIFDNDPAGKKFVAALARAVGRGVAVRVLVDSAGTRYSFPPITHLLRHTKIPHARFLPSSLLQPWRAAFMNLRNHRKVLITDGKIAFTGGMNIRQGNLLKESPRSPVQDLHFRVAGPVVTQLQEAFARDWAFTAKEVLDGELWFQDQAAAGDLVARVITDGPDADFETLRLTLATALSAAQSSVQIITPYFLPDTAVLSALNLAALRGVKVDILLPAKNNLPFVHWASRAMWWQVLQRGCRIYLTKPPFDHSKLMIVDDHWVLLGSANWDARSLRLNFEMNVECYGREFAARMMPVVASKLTGAREVTLDEVDARCLSGKLKDAAARLFSPYL